MFEGCSEVYMYFSFFLVALASCTPILWPILLWHTLYFIFLIYDNGVCSFYSPTFTCVASFLSLYTCFFVYAIFISVSHMMPWWVLFKCFRKTSYESLSCHELSSCKVFQEFMLGLDLLCNTTSGYELSDLKLLSWFFFFCCGFVTDF